MVWRQFILVLDDDKDVVIRVSGLLRKQGFNVHAFNDPMDALADFKQNCNDCFLIVSDIRMPHMNGFQFVRKAREIKPDIKVVFMIAFEISISEFEKIHPSMKVSGLVEKPILMRKSAALINNSMTATATIRNEKRDGGRVLMNSSISREAFGKLMQDVRKTIDDVDKSSKGGAANIVKT